MAALARVRQMSLLQRCMWNHVNKISRGINSTSKKDSGSVSTESSKQSKNWVSYGFDFKDQDNDTNVHHASFFFSVTLCIVFGSFLWAYSPDINMRDWAQREAFLELRRREKGKKPPIDPNYIANVVLPSESAIADMDIVI